MRSFFAAASLALLLLAAGCADQNFPVQNPHAGNTLAGHAALARADLASCKACHGKDYSGGSSGVDCYACHPKGSSFILHPSEWADVLADHGGFAGRHHWTLCAQAACHGANLKGGSGSTFTGPSCFQAGCHLSRTTAAHALPLLLPTQHGARGRDEEKFCFNCHGDLPNEFNGGFASNVNIVGHTSAACNGCHEEAQAHPTSWQGTNDIDNSYVSSHRPVPSGTISTGCVLCHNVSGPGAGPKPGAPSCFSNSFLNADGSNTSCHAFGPGHPHPTDLSWYDRNGANFHGNSALNCAECHTLSVFCVTCHFTATGSRVPPGTGWTHGFSGHKVYGAYQTVCNKCHAIERQLGYAPAPCHDCHGD